MTQPSLLDYLIGNRLICALALIASAFSAYQCWVGELSVVAPIASILSSSWALQSAGRVRRYRDWNAEWDGLGRSSKPKLNLLAIVRSPAARLVIGIPLLLLTVANIGSLWNNGGQIPVLMAAIGFAICVGVPLKQWLARRAMQAPPKEEYASIPDYKAKRATDSRPTISQLPDYCQQLFSNERSE